MASHGGAPKMSRLLDVAARTAETRSRKIRDLRNESDGARLTNFRERGRAGRRIFSAGSEWKSGSRRPRSSHSSAPL